MVGKLCIDGRVRFSVDLACNIDIESSILYSLLKDRVNSKGLAFIDLYQMVKPYPFLSYSTARRKMQKLESYGCLEILPNKDKVKLLSTIKNDNLFGNEVCEWCKSKAITLEGHHYPISKSDGGVEIVNICPNCHSAFHHSILVRVLECKNISLIS